MMLDAQSLEWTLETGGYGEPPAGWLRWSGWFNDVALVDEAIQRLGLEARVRAAFPKTCPQWYGLWMNSPLSREQCLLAREILREAAREWDAEGDADIVAFLAALDRAAGGNLPMHISVSPPGGSDLYLRITEAHCPRCKAITPHDLLETLSETDSLPCPVCGNTFIPWKTRMRESVYYTDMVVCINCNGRTPMKAFTDEEKTLLHWHHQYHWFQTDLRLLRETAELCQRDPRVAQAQSGNDPEAIEALLASPPENGWPRLDRGILEYLKTNSFEIKRRRRFVQEEIKRYAPLIERDFVFCPACKGPVH